MTDADIVMFRKLRELGMTRYTEGSLTIEFGASVMMSAGEPVSRMLDDEEEEEIAKRVLDKHTQRMNEDLYGAT